VSLLRVLTFLLGLGVAGAHAQVATPSQCGPTSVGSSSAVAGTFPASGATGNSAPARYLMIFNPSASATLWVNPLSGGTAAANAAGSVEIAAGASFVWSNTGNGPPPAAFSIIASASSTPVTCLYN
jgi:hypothetical protein